MRRVIQIAGRLIFDDTPTPSHVGGGGGGIQTRLIRGSGSDAAIAVVNPDGTNISGGGGGGGGDVEVTNFPDEYPLPEAQLNTLTPQTDALTDDELRANPLDVNLATTNYTTRIEEDSGDSNLTYIGNAVIGSAEASAVWQIKLLDSTAGLVKLWRDGNDNFDNAWSTREAGSYS